SSARTTLPKRCGTPAKFIQSLPSDHETSAQPIPSARRLTRRLRWDRFPCDQSKEGKRMGLETTRTFDVLVVGGGIAGTTAALHAARSGARTAIACTGALFSGSSFYPGTWGLGLVG